MALTAKQLLRTLKHGKSRKLTEAPLKRAAANVTDMKRRYDQIMKDLEKLQDEAEAESLWADDYAGFDNTNIDRAAQWDDYAEAMSDIATNCETALYQLRDDAGVVGSGIWKDVFASRKKLGI
jgi:hypothetical protein